MLLRIAPVQRIVRVAAGLRDEDGAPIARRLDVLAPQPTRVEDVGAVVAVFID